MKPVTSVCDFETASAINLKKSGAWAYAEHPTTEVLCLSFETTHGDRSTWKPEYGKYRHQDDFSKLVINPDVMFVSHGDFERAIWRCIMVPLYGFPDIPNERWHDTMSVAAMKQLPLELDLLTSVLGLPDTKDREGSKHTIALSKPNKKTGMLDRSPASLARTYTYCESDVLVERGVLNRIGWLQPGERRVWLLDQVINQRGVRIDMEYVDACQSVVDGAFNPLQAEFGEITGGLTITQRDRIMDWIGGQGASVPDLRKETLVELLGHDIDADEPEGDADGDLGDVVRRVSSLPNAVRRVLEIRQLAGSASIKKLAAMRACTSGDGRARGLLQYHRAGPGRWAGRLLQPQNFPRPSLKYGDGEKEPVEIDTIVGAMMTGDWQYVEMMLGPAIPAVVSGLRHAMIADPGNGYVSGDFAQIEARFVLALAGQHDKIKLFETGTPYQDMAQSIYGRPIDKHRDLAEYTIGKNTVLGCGFQMGAQKFFDRYCPKQTIDFAERVINIYRKEWAPLVPPVWYGLQDAATACVWSGEPREAYGVRYALEDGWLTARIPSGRKLYYWNPQKVRRTMPWDHTDIRPGFTYEAMKTGQWKTIYAFGGLLTENVVQAMARDMLVYSMFRLEEEGYPLVLTVHDEALIETLTGRLDEKAVTEIMTERPDWVVGLGVPIKVETWTGDRYRK